MTSNAGGAARSEREAALAVRAYLDALAKGDLSAACERLATSVRKDLAALAGYGQGAAGRCSEALAALLDRVDGETLAQQLAGAELGTARVEGGRAEVEIESPESPVHLRKEDGEWRISRLRSRATARLAVRLEAIEPL